MSADPLTLALERVRRVVAKLEDHDDRKDLATALVNELVLYECVGCQAPLVKSVFAQCDACKRRDAETIAALKAEARR